MSFHSGFLSCRRILLMLKIKGVMMAGGVWGQEKRRCSSDPIGGGGCWGRAKLSEHAGHFRSVYSVFWNIPSVESRCWWVGISSECWVLSRNSALTLIVEWALMYWAG